MKNTFLAALLLGCSLATTASAQTADRRFDVEGFDAIELSGSSNVRVTSGRTVSVVASGDPRSVAALAVDVRGGTLRISRQVGTSDRRRSTVLVTVPTLRAATISGSGELDVGPVVVDTFAADISGSGTVRISGLTARSARFAMSGSGTIVASGRAEAVVVDLSGTGRVDATALPSGSADVSLSGSGSISASASGSATVRAAGSGEIRISGGARCDVRNGGGVTVRCP